jgi:hypothetical protein
VLSDDAGGCEDYGGSVEGEVGVWFDRLKYYFKPKASIGRTWLSLVQLEKPD